MNIATYRIENHSRVLLGVREVSSQTTQTLSY